MKIYHSFWDGGYKTLDANVYNMHKLSVLTALKNYGNITLITTEKGREFLGSLPYTSIELFEEEIPDNLKATWSISKIYAYKQIAKKGEPFFHIDYDVFIFKKLPEWFENSEVVCQHFESEYELISTYNLEIFSKKCPNKYFFDGTVDYACNAGILGGNNMSAIIFYVDEVIKLLTDKDNIENYWENNNLNINYWSKAVIAEQLYIVYCLEKLNIKPTPLFKNGWPSEEKAIEIGYTHLMGSKNNFGISTKIEKKIKQYENF